MRRLMIALATIAATIAAACAPVAPRKVTRAPGNLPGEDESGHLAHLYSELQDDILSLYDRDEATDLDSGMVDPRVGAARIGAGADDLWLSGRGGKREARWPLDTGFATRTEIRSKALQIQIAVDQSAAWMSDELSWRLEVCGRTAVIPLRITALYAHDGDRWVSVFEHVSFGWALSDKAPVTDPKLRLKSAYASVDLKDDLSGALGRGLLHAPHDKSVVSQDPLAVVLGPDAGDEWHGPKVLDAKLPPGRTGERRIGIVGRDPATATVAYWVGDYIADLPSATGAPPAHVTLRATHVFEKRHAKPGSELDACSGRDRGPDCRWVLVGSHVSQPITDEQLTNKIFGSARPSLQPIELPWLARLLQLAPASSTRLECSDGTPVTTGAFGAAAPAATPGAARRPGR